MVSGNKGSGGKKKNSTSLNEEDYFAKLNEQALKKIKGEEPEGEKKDTK